MIDWAKKLVNWVTQSREEKVRHKKTLIITKPVPPHSKLAGVNPELLIYFANTPGHGFRPQTKILVIKGVHFDSYCLAGYVRSVEEHPRRGSKSL